MSDEKCLSCSYNGDEKYKLCRECSIKNEAAISDFVKALDAFKEVYGERSACEVMSGLISARLKREAKP